MMMLKHGHKIVVFIDVTFTTNENSPIAMVFNMSLTSYKLFNPHNYVI